MDRSFSRMKNLFAISCILCPALSLASASSYGENEDLLGFDGIVNELHRETQSSSGPGSSRARAPQFSSSVDPFDSILMHIGVGYTAMTQNVSLNDSESMYLNMKGVQAAFGIDLFSENWMAEGTARNFGDSEGASAKASLQEFELKLFYKNRLSRQLGVRGGAGLSARYLTIRHPTLGVLEYTTPSSVATLGVDLYMNDTISIGAEASARNTMIAETLDRTSLDATMRLDLHF